VSRVRASFELHCWHRTRWAIPSAGGRVWHAPQLFLHSSPIHLPVHLRQDQSSSAAHLPDSSGQVAKHGSVKMAGTSPAAKPHPRPRLALADRVLAHVRRRWCGHDTCDAHESSAEVAHYQKLIALVCTVGEAHHTHGSEVGSHFVPFALITTASQHGMQPPQHGTEATPTPSAHATHRCSWCTVSVPWKRSRQKRSAATTCSRLRNESMRVRSQGRESTGSHYRHLSLVT